MRIWIMVCNKKIQNIGVCILENSNKLHIKFHKKIINARAPPFFVGKKIVQKREEKMEKQTKRRRDKLNPYIIKQVDNSYMVHITKTNHDKVFVDKKVYDEMNIFELKDIAQLNEYDRHIEHYFLSEEELNKRKIEKATSVEDIVINKLELERLHKAILKLPRIQRRRVLMHYFMDLTQKEIAIKESVSIRAIQYSLKIALINLKKILKKAS